MKPERAYATSRPDGSFTAGWERWLLTRWGGGGWGETISSSMLFYHPSTFTPIFFIEISFVYPQLVFVIACFFFYFIWSFRLFGSFVINTFTPIFFIDISFGLPPPPRDYWETTWLRQASWSANCWQPVWLAGGRRQRLELRLTSTLWLRWVVLVESAAEATGLGFVLLYQLSCVESCFFLFQILSNFTPPPPQFHHRFMVRAFRGWRKEASRLRQVDQVEGHVTAVVKKRLLVGGLFPSFNSLV